MNRQPRTKRGRQGRRRQAGWSRPRNRAAFSTSPTDVVETVQWATAAPRMVLAAPAAALVSMVVVGVDEDELVDAEAAPPRLVAHGVLPMGRGPAPGLPRGLVQGGCQASLRLVCPLLRSSPPAGGLSRDARLSAARATPSDRRARADTRGTRTSRGRTAVGPAWPAGSGSGNDGTVHPPGRRPRGARHAEGCRWS